jgi:hypothetical protein
MKTDELIGKLNDAKRADPDGFFQEYTLFIYFSNGTNNQFAINGSLIIDKSTKNCFQIQEEKYFERLWEEVRIKKMFKSRKVLTLSSMNYLQNLNPIKSTD